MNKGWPEKHQIPKSCFLIILTAVKSHTVKGILLKNQWIIVPTILRSEMKLIIHQGYSDLEVQKNAVLATN